MMQAMTSTGWLTLLYKELLRFWKVSFQTIAAPVLTALLYLLIFSHVLESRVSVFDGRVRYTAFLIPGLVMMSVLQNSFANASSSIIQSKVTGNLIFVLLPPLSPLDMYAAYVLGAPNRTAARLPTTATTTIPGSSRPAAAPNSAVPAAATYASLVCAPAPGAAMTNVAVTTM